MKSDQIVSENLTSVRNRIAIALNKRQNISEVDQPKIICVTKTFSAESVSQLLNLGMRDFGENYVQEWQHKREQFPHVNWHFIGRLQSNKLREVLGNCALMHSLDRHSLFEKAVKICAELSIQQKVLLQVNVAGEDSKGGFSTSEILRLLPSFLGQKNLSICGFMTMPPLQNSAEQNRVYFKALRDLREQTANLRTDEHTLSELSMGTSQDFEVAIEEGSTMVRLGTVLLGARAKGEQ